MWLRQASPPHSQPQVGKLRHAGRMGTGQPGAAGLERKRQRCRPSCEEGASGAPAPPPLHPAPHADAEAPTGASHSP